MLRVLVIDDEMGMRKGVGRALRHFSVRLEDIAEDITFSVEEATAAEAALEIIKTDPPPIVLLDHRLPGMSGIELLDEIRKMNLPDTLVIMITAYATIETAVAATRRGAYDFLAKPFTPDELRSVIQKAAGRIMLQRRARRLAEEKRAVRFQFISVLAHELKSPLAAIESYLTTIRDKVAGDDPAVYDRMIDRALVRSQWMRKLIVDLLDLTRIESGQKSRELAELDLVQTARSAIEGVQKEAGEKNITICLDAPGSVTVEADASEMTMLMNNLLTNAVKYNRDGGSVQVKIRNGDGQVEIAVADTGIGMTPEEQRKLFGEFSRIKNEKTQNILGSGLGLSIVKKIVDLYNGEVAVASVSGEGTTFTVTLRKSSRESAHESGDN